MAAKLKSNQPFASELLSLLSHGYAQAYPLQGSGFFDTPQDAEPLLSPPNDFPSDLEPHLSESVIATLDSRPFAFESSSERSLWALKLDEGQVIGFWGEAPESAEPLMAGLSGLLEQLLSRWTPKTEVPLVVHEDNQAVTDTEALEAAIDQVAEQGEIARQTPRLMDLYGEQFLFHPLAAYLCFGKDGTISPLYPDNLHPYFGQLENKTNALELLLSQWVPYNRDSASFAASDPDIAMLQDLMETVFMRITDLDVLKEMLPNEIRQGGTVLRVDYKYLQADSIDDDLIMVQLSDTSELEKVTEQLQETKEHGEMVLRIALDIEGYKQYRQTSEEILRSVIVELEKPTEAIRPESILGSIKALQSGAEIFEIKEIASVTERFESSLQAILNSEVGFGDDNLVELMMLASDVKDCFDRLQSDYLQNLVETSQVGDSHLYPISEQQLSNVEKALSEKVLHASLEQAFSVFDKNYRPFMKLPGLEKLTAQRLKHIQDFIGTTLIDEAKHSLHNELDQLRKQPIGFILNKYGKIAENLCRNQNKAVVIEIQGADIEVPLHRMQGLFSALIHLIRNSVEHGIEKMEERVFLGKDLEGHLWISASEQEDRLLLIFKDDGRGLDPQQVRDKAVASGQLTAEAASALGEQEVFQLLFSFDLENPLSARGVGLESVYFRVRELGGSLTIHSEPEKGTEIHINVPLNC